MGEIGMLGAGKLAVGPEPFPNITGICCIRRRQICRTSGAWDTPSILLRRVTDKTCIRSRLCGTGARRGRYGKFEHAPLPATDPDADAMESQAFGSTE